MGTRWWGRLAAVAGTAAVVGLAAASPAWADTTVGINPGNVPTTAEGHGDHGCDFGGGPFADKDVWVFVLPGNDGKVGDFVSVTAVFDNGTLTIPDDGGAIVDDKGTSKAWITTPAGWTLTGATAVITGTAEKFNLTHTCPGGGGGEETPTPVPSESATPTPTAPETPGGSVSGTPGAGSGGGSLPVTGGAIMTTVVLGAAMVAGGAALLAVRRRREAHAFAAADDTEV